MYEKVTCGLQAEECKNTDTEQIKSCSKKSPVQ